MPIKANQLGDSVLTFGELYEVNDFLSANQLTTGLEEGVTAVPAPGANTIAIIRYVEFSFEVGINRYTTGSPIFLRYKDADGTVATSSGFNSTYLLGTEDRRFLSRWGLNLNVFTTTGKETINQPIIFRATTNYEAGDGILKYQIKYNKVSTII